MINLLAEISSADKKMDRAGIAPRVNDIFFGEKKSYK